MKTSVTVTSGTLIACTTAMMILGCSPSATQGRASDGPRPPSAAAAKELRVMISGGLTAAYLELAPEIEEATGRKLVTSFGASMGKAPDAIPVRLQRGEPADVLIMVGYALQNLIDEGKVRPDSKVDLARSTIGVAVKKGAPQPDISSVEAFKQAMLDADSIAYSASASGRYVSTKLFPRLGIADQVAAKSSKILSERVGTVVARGDAQIGFQQMSELIPIEGIDVVGPLPAEIQKVTIFSAGITVGAVDRDAAQALIDFMSSGRAAAVITKSGMEPFSDDHPSH